MGPEDGTLVVRVESRNGIGRIALLGDLDMSTVPALSDNLANVEAADVDTIMLDVRDVTFADASALHAFLEARNRAAMNGHRFMIVGAGPPVRRLFDITGTGSLFEEPEAASIIDHFSTGRIDVSGGALDRSIADA